MDDHPLFDKMSDLLLELYGIISQNDKLKENIMKEEGYFVAIKETQNIVYSLNLKISKLSNKEGKNVQE